MKVADMLGNVSRRLRATSQNDTHDANNDVEMVDVDDLEFLAGEDDSESEPDYDDADLFEGDGAFTFGADREIGDTFQPMEISTLIQQRFRRDLLSVFKAGFHTGKACGFEKGSLESIAWISIRVSKLHLSGEIRDAWDLASSEYIILLIRYLDQYTSFEDVINKPARYCNMSFRLRKSFKKKPTPQQAVAAFSDLQPHHQGSDGLELHSLWISRSIESFMGNDFISLLKLRHKHAVTWTTAKEMLLFQMTSMTSTEDEGLPSIKGERDERHSHDAKLPPILSDDHLLSEGETSLPLIAFQFALHYLVRCTDYCTICHRKSEGNLDALKPYVCNQPLCLFQYMNLGFGPSIETEIINQPTVVDLLVSLCFVSLSSLITPSSATKGRMREFPTGLNLHVPKIRKSLVRTNNAEELHRCIKVGDTVLMDSTAVSFNSETSTATITGDDNFSLREDQCVVVVVPVAIRGTGSNQFTEYSDLVLIHARIESKYGKLLTLKIMSRHTMPTPDSPGGLLVDEEIDNVMPPNAYSGHIVPYDQEMDSLDSEEEKAFSMSIILTSLPSIEDMRSYLRSNSLQSLTKWDRMTKAAVDLLRWIIASNRSYIVQVDGGPTDVRPHEKISGVDGWIQFRFAQGSPENDVLFNKVLEGINKPQKTLVAWHGSRLENWHSIIRQGLNYTEQLNGRAYGNGIYFSKLFDTSAAYSSYLSMPTSQVSVLSQTLLLSKRYAYNLAGQDVYLAPIFNRGDFCGEFKRTCQLSRELCIQQPSLRGASLPLDSMPLPLC